jgi:hypothetical protein
MSHFFIQSSDSDRPVALPYVEESSLKALLPLDFQNSKLIFNGQTISKTNLS